MKISRFFLLTAIYTCANVVSAAAPSLPDLSYGTADPYSYNSAPSSNQILDAIAKLQNDVNQLKTNAANQNLVINDLKARQAKLESYRATVINSQPQAILGTTTLVPQGLVPQDSKYHATASVGEKVGYESARTLLNNNENDQAIAAFQNLIRTYPNGAFADNSEYWMGEALLKKGDKVAAMQSFDRIVRLYPGSPKIPDALLKLGMTQTMIGNKVKAKEYYDYLIAAYPGTPSASIAYSKRAGL